MAGTTCYSLPAPADGVRRLLSMQTLDLSRDNRWAAHQPLYIDQYECLTASPSVARHHVLALTLLRSAARFFRVATLLALAYFGVQWKTGL